MYQLELGEKTRVRCNKNEHHYTNKINNNINYDNDNNGNVLFTTHVVIYLAADDCTREFETNDESKCIIYTRRHFKNRR